jgi:transcriptional regulator
MNRPPDDSLLRGTVDALILKTLTWGPRHGYDIARWVHDTSDAALPIEDRALYLALHRLEAKRLVESTWGLSANNRKAKYYQLTPAGRAHLKIETARLMRYVKALTTVLGTTAWGGAR